MTKQAKKKIDWEKKVDKLFERVYFYSEAGAVETAHDGVKKLIRSLLSSQLSDLRRGILSNRRKELKRFKDNNLKMSEYAKGQMAREDDILDLLDKKGGGGK